MTFKAVDSEGASPLNVHAMEMVNVAYPSPNLAPQAADRRQLMQTALAKAF